MCKEYLSWYCWMYKGFYLHPLKPIRQINLFWRDIIIRKPKTSWSSDANVWKRVSKWNLYGLCKGQSFHETRYSYNTISDVHAHSVNISILNNNIGKINLQIDVNRYDVSRF